MKKRKHLLLLLFSILSLEGFSQSYEVIYSSCSQEVKTKIDQNKIDGINILSGIKSVQTIGVSGLGLSQKTTITQQLSVKSDVFSFTLNDDNTSISIVSLPSFTKESFKEILDAFQATITGYNVNFIIED